MTPSIPASSHARTRPFSSASPVGKAATTTQGQPPELVVDSQGLQGVVQPSGRTPTHVLTAKSPVSEADAKKAEDLHSKADKFFEKKNYKQALNFYRKALEKNPGDAKSLLGLAKTEHATGDLFSAHDHYADYLKAEPKDLGTRELRLTVNQLIMRGLEQIAGKVPPERRAEFAGMVQNLTVEIALDNATLLAKNGDKVVENLKKQLELLSGKSKAEKQRALSLAVANVQQILKWKQLPAFDPAEQETQVKKLDELVVNSYGVLADFTKADQDTAIQGLAPLFEGQQALLSGKPEAAAKAFQKVRDEGLKTLGKGDAVAGEKLLQEKMDKIAKLVAENKPGEIDQVLADLPLGLVDAYAFMKTYETQKVRIVSLASLEAWEASIYASETVEAKKVTGFWHDVNVIIFKNPDSLDDMAREARKQCDLIDEVRKQLKSGKSGTIQEALEAVRDTSTDSGMVDRAKKALERVKDGSADSVGFSLGKLVSFSSIATPGSGAVDEILAQADTMADKGEKRLAGILYTLVQAQASDKGQQDKAETAFKKLPDNVQKELAPEKKG